jgi:hypothetical protein
LNGFFKSCALRKPEATTINKMAKNLVIFISPLLPVIWIDILSPLVNQTLIKSKTYFKKINNDNLLAMLFFALMKHQKFLNNKDLASFN